MSHRMLVPLDGSPLAERALDEALTLAQLPDSKVVLLRVIPSIDEVISDGETFTIDQQWENRAGRARDYLRGICQRPAWRKVAHEVAVEQGDPANVILEFAQRNAIDRIILCTHGRTGVSRWVHGSVARKILEAADRTVVLVRAGLPRAHG
jgi:nucleotide-binding universal stress UspA family protein